MREKNMRNSETQILPYAGNTGSNIQSRKESEDDAATKAVLRLQQQDSGMEPSDSMILIDESARHMLDLMKGLNAREPEGITAACNCARQIEKLMRLKLDVLRTKKGLY